MLINLNSIDESDPANFRNTLSQGLVIKPNSYICLVGATITRNAFIKKIIFNSAGKALIKLNAYDIYEVNVAAGNYTPLEFCNIINAPFIHYDTKDSIGAISAISSLHVTPVDPPDGSHDLLFEIKWKGEPDSNGENLRTLLGQSIDYNQFLARNMFGKTTANLKPNAINQINSVIGGNSGIYTVLPGVVTAATPLNPNGYTIPPNQVNGAALNMGSFLDNYLDNNFFIGQPNLPNIKFLLGRAEYDTANNRYSSSAYFGSPQWSNPGIVNNCPFYLHFKNTGTYDSVLFNTTTNAFDTFSTDLFYNPGDFFRVVVRRTPKDPIVDRYAGTIALEHANSNGLVYLFPMLLNNLASAPQWNTYTPRANDLSFYITATSTGVFDLNLYNTAWDGGAAKTKTAPIGVRCGTGTTGEGNYADCNSNNGFSFVNTAVAANIDLQTGNAKTYLNGTPFFQRYTGSAAPSTSPDLRCSMLISDTASGGIKISDKPFMLSWYFKLVDDTAKLPGGAITDVHNFINDAPTAQRMVMVLPSAHATAAGYDVELYLNGVTQTIILTDPTTGTRITLDYAKDYYFFLSNPGTINNTYTATIYDIATAVSYTGSVISTDKFNNIGHLSKPDVGNFIQTFNGYFGEFRIHQHSQNAKATSTLWDTVKADLISYINSGTRNLNYWWGFTNNRSFPIEAYRNIGLINNRATLTPVFDKDTMTIGHDQNWGDFVNPTFSHATYVKNNLRVTNGEVDYYDGDELGLLDVALLDPDGADDIVFDGIDARGNVLIEPNRVGDDVIISSVDAIKAELKDINLEDKTINVEIPNLPHRSYNGANKTQDKTIGQIPINGLNSNKLEEDNLNIITSYPPSKVWIPFNNPGEIPLNELQVKLSDVKGVQIPAVEIAQETNIQIEIKSRNEIF